MFCKVPFSIFLIFILACQKPANESDVRYYQDKHRPQFHFSPEKMWMNDPNGMVYYQGEYHLFYQYYPDSTVWGPMHWGHAVSSNMIHWQHLPIALYPDSLGYIFSGSAVVDWKNTSGLGTIENPPLVAIYTYHDFLKEKVGRNDFQTQGLAYSLDYGRNWKKYALNPVLKNPGIRDFRDPKVFWYQPSESWVMTLAVADHIEFFESRDLKKWTKLSDFGIDQGGHGGVWECPDLFSLSLNGKQKWVLIVNLNPGGSQGGSGTQYFIGDFDGKKFINDNPKEKILWADFGKDNYAGVTWSDIPERDGRRILLGWMSNWNYASVVPTSPWRSAMTVPRTLKLMDTPDGIRLSSWPVKELGSLEGKSYSFPKQIISDALDLSGDLPFTPSTYEMILELDSLDKGFELELFNERNQKLLIGYETDQNRFYIDRSGSGKNDFSPDFAGRHYAPRILKDNRILLRLLVDVSSVELFADEGLVVMTNLFFPDEVFHQIRLRTLGGKIELKAASITELSSAWKRN